MLLAKYDVLNETEELEELEATFSCDSNDDDGPMLDVYAGDYIMHLTGKEMNQILEVIRETQELLTQQKKNNTGKGMREKQ